MKLAVSSLAWDPSRDDDVPPSAFCSRRDGNRDCTAQVLAVPRDRYDASPGDLPAAVGRRRHFDRGASGHPVRHAGAAALRRSAATGCTRTTSRGHGSGRRGARCPHHRARCTGQSAARNRAGNGGDRESRSPVSPSGGGGGRAGGASSASSQTRPSTVRTLFERRQKPWTWSLPSITRGSRSIWTLAQCRSARNSGRQCSKARGRPATFTSARSASPLSVGTVQHSALGAVLREGGFVGWKSIEMRPVPGNVLLEALERAIHVARESYE